MLAHSFIEPLVYWGTLHAVQIAAGLLALRGLRGRWPWAAMIASAVAAVLGPLGMLALLLCAEFGGAGGVFNTRVLGITVGELFAWTVCWFSLPLAAASVLIDPRPLKRPASFISRVCGATAGLYLLTLM